jgi:hypothetical protein
VEKAVESPRECYRFTFEGIAKPLEILLQEPWGDRLREAHEADPHNFWRHLSEACDFYGERIESAPTRSKQRLDYLTTRSQLVWLLNRLNERMKLLSVELVSDPVVAGHAMSV